MWVLILLVVIAIVAGWKFWRQRFSEEDAAYVREVELYLIAQEVSRLRRAAEMDRPYPLFCPKSQDAAQRPRVILTDEAIDRAVAAIGPTDLARGTPDGCPHCDAPAPDHITCDAVQVARCVCGALLIWSRGATLAERSFPWKKAS